MGFWSKLGKIASFAAPIVAAPFTGGASLALIGAGAGAASGALSGGGWKGALLGAGIGGASAGLLNGGGSAAAKLAGAPGTITNGLPSFAGVGTAVGNTARGTFGQALKNTFLNPNTLGAIGKVTSDMAGAASDSRQKGNAERFLRDQELYKRYQDHLANEATLPKTFATQAYAADVLGNYNSHAADIFNAKTRDELNAARTQRSWEMNEDTKKALAEWQRRAILNLMNPPKAPELRDPEGAGAAEKILGGVGLATNLGAALRGYIPPRTT